MEKNLISLSFVGVLKQPLTVIPNLEGRFCRELFGMPYETFNGITPEGFTIAINNKPFPIVIISPTKIIVKANKKELLIKYVEAIKGELIKLKVPVSFTAFGINSEYQWLELDDNADSWLWNHFINKEIKTGYEYHVCNKINLRIGINDLQLVNLELEPRMGIRNGLFANINHHHNIVLEEMPTSELLNKFIEESGATINSDIITKLIEN